MNCYIFSDDVLNDDELNFISEMLKKKSRSNKPSFNFPFNSSQPISDDDVIRLAVNLNLSIGSIEQIMKKDYS